MAQWTVSAHLPIIVLKQKYIKDLGSQASTTALVCLKTLRLIMCSTQDFGRKAKEVATENKSIHQMKFTKENF